MTPNEHLKQVTERLKRFNEWRRGENPNTFETLNISPKQIGEDIDCVIKLYNEMSNSVTVACVYFPNVHEYITSLEKRLDRIDFMADI